MEDIIPDDYLDMKRVMGLNASKDYVVWVHQVAKPQENGYTSSIKLYNRSTGGIKAFTSGSKRDYYPRFSPDGTKLAFISTRNKKPQIFVMDMNGGEAHLLTKSKNGVRGFSWSPDGHKIAYSAMIDPENGEEVMSPPGRTKFENEMRKATEEEKERKLKDPMVYSTLTYRRDTSYDHPNRYAHLFVIDLETKDSNRISDGKFHHSVPKFISNNVVVSISNREVPRDLGTKTSLVKFSTDTKSEGEILIKVDQSWPVDPVANDKGLMFVNCYGPGSYAGQTSKWARIKDGNAEIINESLDRNVNQLRILDDNTLLVGVDHHGKTDIRSYDLTTKQFSQLFDAPLSVVDFDATSLDEIYFTATDPKHVWAVWKWSKDGVELLEDPNKETFANKKIVEPEEVWLENPEGTKFHGWFFDTDLQDGKKPPMVLSIHGGPHAMWNNAGTMWHEWQVTLARGYSVLALNPIGSQGYGQDYAQVITAKWGVDDARDLIQAVDHFADRVDMDRLYITGGSYAGFQTANIISRDDRFKAACAQRGVYDLVTFGLNTDIPLWATWEWEGTPWERLQHLWDHSPVGRAKHINTPLLIIHAENDFRVAISQAEELFAALKLDNKEAVLVRYPRDGHELSRSGEPLHVVDRIERMLDWFDMHP